MKNSKQQSIYPATVQRADQDSVEVHVHIIVIRTIAFPDRIASAEVMQKMECFSELTSERFEVVVLSDNIEDGRQRKLRFFRRTVERICGWRVKFFDASDSATANCNIMIDRARMILFINIDMLRLPINSFVKICVGLPKMINTALSGLKLAFDGLGRSDGAMSPSAMQDDSIILTLSDKGLLMPTFISLLAEDRVVRITVTDVAICIQSTGWRWIHRTSVPLPFYSYKVEVAVDGGSYLIAMPPDVLEAIKGALRR